MRKTFSILIAFCFLSVVVCSQEIQAKLTVNVNKDKIPTTVDRKIFQTLQTGLTNFVNNRKWTNDAFQTTEKIQCNFLLNINDVGGQNIYRATLTVQAARPAYNSTYQCPLINFIDDNVVFKYVEYQPIEFNENRVQGNDALVSNLTAVFAYWVNIILGFDYDSFSLRGGAVAVLALARANRRLDDDLTDLGLVFRLLLVLDFLVDFLLLLVVVCVSFAISWSILSGV